uniref:Uncharacterized protein n=1 Tax=Moniliophthora roreri TaxID=221103 RepID=A0A0W0FKU3_MONRR
MPLLHTLAQPIFPDPLVSNNSASLFDPETGQCININGCRTIASLLWSCLSVIFICTWTAIHPNIPRVETNSIDTAYQGLRIMIVALIAPEVIIMWAMRQWLSARNIVKKFKKYGWGKPHAFLVLMGGFALYDGDQFCGYLWESREEVDERYWDLVMAHHARVQEVFRWHEGDSMDFENQQNHEGRVSDIPTLPRFQVDLVSQEKELREKMCLLEFFVANGYITITEDEIRDNLSQGDFISKSVAVIQTSWFLAQVVTRAVEGLAITELEIITVGFALLNFGTYFLWWSKPLRVRHPIRVNLQQRRCQIERPPGHTFLSVLWMICKLISLPVVLILRFGYTILRAITYDFYLSLQGVGRFSSRLKKEQGRVWLTAFLITGAFGALHCVAWNFQFPTPIEQFYWRLSAVIATIAPFFFVTLGLLLYIAGDFVGVLGHILTVLAYIAARIALIILAVGALRDLPPNANQVVPWTRFIPHIG